MLRKVTLGTLAILCLSVLPITASPTQPSLEFDHQSGPMGAKIALNGNLTVPDSEVDILFDITLVATSMTAPDGTFNASFYVPAVGSGDHVVTAYQYTNRTNAITVTFRVTYGINDIQTDIQSLGKRVSDLEKLITLLNNTVTSVNNQTSGMVQSRLPNIERNLMDLQADFSALTKVLNPVINSITSLTQNAATRQDVTSLRENVSELSDTLSSAVSTESSVIQLLLIVLQSSIAVSIVLGVSILYVLKRRRRSKSDDWEVFD